MYTVHDVVDMLKVREYAVTFAKKDGEIRTIVGSLPGDAHAKNEDCVPILESTTGLWKSFRLDSMIEMV